MTHYNKKPSDPVRYRPEDPNCYTYVDGYGFAPPPPVITERRMLQFYSNGLGFAILLYFLMAASVPFGVLRLFSLIWPVIRVYGNQVVASSSIIQLVNIFSSTICMLVPFLLFMLLCRVPARVAFPMKRFSPSLCVPCIFVAMGVSVIGLASSSLLGRFLELFGLQPHVAISIPQNPLALLLFAVQLCVLTPLVEEVVFRGIIFQSMRRFGHRLSRPLLRLAVGRNHHPRGQQSAQFSRRPVAPNHPGTLSDVGMAGNPFLLPDCRHHRHAGTGAGIPQSVHVHPLHHPIHRTN